MDLTFRAATRIVDEILRDSDVARSLHRELGNPDFEFYPYDFADSMFVPDEDNGNILASASMIAGADMRVIRSALIQCLVMYGTPMSRLKKAKKKCTCALCRKESIGG